MTVVGKLKWYLANNAKRSYLEMCKAPFIATVVEPNKIIVSLFLLLVNIRALSSCQKVTAIAY